MPDQSISQLTQVTYSSALLIPAINPTLPVGEKNVSLPITQFPGSTVAPATDDAAGLITLTQVSNIASAASDGAISTITTQIGTINSSISALETQSDILSADYLTLSGTVLTLSSEYSGLGGTSGSLVASVGSIDGQIDTINISLTALGSQASTLTSVSGSLTASIGLISGQIGTINTSLTALGSQTSALNNEFLTLSGTSTSLATSVGSINTQIGTINTSLTTHTAQIGTLNSEMLTLSGTSTSLVTSVGSINTQIGTINTSLTTHTAQIGTLNSEMLTLSGTSTSLVTSVGSINTQIGTINTEVGTINASLTSQSALMSTLSSEYTTLSAASVSLVASVGTISGQVGTINTEVGTINASLTAQAAQISTLSSEYAGVSSTSAGLVSSVGSINSQVGTINTSLAAIGSIASAALPLSALGSASGAAELDASGWLAGNTVGANHPAVPFVAGLRTYPYARLTFGDFIYVANYGVVGDGGGNWWQWINGTAADDGITTILPTGLTGAGRFVVRPAGGVLTFAAAGIPVDNVSMIDAAWAAATAAAAANNYKLFGGGGYTFNFASTLILDPTAIVVDAPGSEFYTVNDTVGFIGMKVIYTASEQSNSIKEQGNITIAAPYRHGPASCFFLAQTSGTALTVISLTSGTGASGASVSPVISLGQSFFGPLAYPDTKISSQSSGTAGGAGSYVLSHAALQAIGATITASISGTIMTVTADSVASVLVGQVILGLSPTTWVLPYGLQGTNGVGGIGTYAVTTGADLKGAAASGILTVAAQSITPVEIGDTINGLSPTATITGFGTGSGGAGTYFYSPSTASGTPTGTSRGVPTGTPTGTASTFTSISQNFGVSFSDTASATNSWAAGALFRNLTVKGFFAGLTFGDNAFLIKAENANLSGNYAALLYPYGLINSGENAIILVNSSASDNDYGPCIFGGGGVRMIGGSIDYNIQRQASLCRGGALYLVGDVHMESNYDNDSHLVCADSSTFIDFEGELALTHSAFAPKQNFPWGFNPTSDGSAINIKSIVPSAPNSGYWGNYGFPHLIQGSGEKGVTLGQSSGSGAGSPSTPYTHSTSSLLLVDPYFSKGALYAPDWTDIGTTASTIAGSAYAYNGDPYCLALAPAAGNYSAIRGIFNCSPGDKPLIGGYLNTTGLVADGVAVMVTYYDAQYKPISSNATVLSWVPGSSDVPPSIYTYFSMRPYNLAPAGCAFIGVTLCKGGGFAGGISGSVTIGASDGNGTAWLARISVSIPNRQAVNNTTAVGNFQVLNKALASAVFTVDGTGSTAIGNGTTAVDGYSLTINNATSLNGATVHLIGNSTTQSTTPSKTIAAVGGNYQILSDSGVLLSQLTNAGVRTDTNIVFDKSAQTIVPTTGQNIVFPANCAKLFVSPAGTLASLTLTMVGVFNTYTIEPTELWVIFTQAITAQSWAPGGSATLVGPALPSTISAWDIVKFLYSYDGTTAHIAHQLPK